MVRWLRWHCPPDTGFEIRAQAVWGRSRYLSVTEAPHNTDFHTWMGRKQFLFLSNRRDREPKLEMLIELPASTDEKIFIMKNWHLKNWSIWLTEYLSQSSPYIWVTFPPLKYERVCLPLCKVADTSFHIQRNDFICNAWSHIYIWS